MVFECEGRFQQFIHSKFRENTVRVLLVPEAGDDDSKIVLAVNKYGKVGLYDWEKFNLLHTYMLDLTMPLTPALSSGKMKRLKGGWAHVPPKCQRTHLVVDAVYAPEIKFIIFVTTKNIIQCYDVGEIDSLAFGLEVFPREKFLKLRKGLSPAICRNMGHVETHRIFGHHGSATFNCVEYIPPDEPHHWTSTNPLTKGTDEDGSILPCADANTNHSDGLKGGTHGKIILGDVEGNIIIINIPNPRKPFGKAKERGKLHQLTFKELLAQGNLRCYRAHTEPVREIRFILPRQLIISCSRDKKFSLYVKDYTETTDPYIISLPRGVNCFSYSSALKIIATGGEDGILRLFNQFVVKMPQMELLGHKCAIIAVEFLQVHFSETPILISYSCDVELRAWNPVDYTCLQSIYISRPNPAAVLRTAVPEFGKKPLTLFQPRYEAAPPKVKTGTRNSSTAAQRTCALAKGQNGYIIALYCNSFAKIDIEKDTSHWPFDFDDFMNEFEEMTAAYENKIVKRRRAFKESKYGSKDPNILKLTPEEILNIESKLEGYVQDILKIKKEADKHLGTAVYNPGKKSLSGEGTRKFLDLKNNSELQDIVKQDGVTTAFKSIPLFPLPPIEFSEKARQKGLPLSNLMKEACIGHVSTVRDVIALKNRDCFQPETLRQLDFEANITAKLAEQESRHDT